jgi:Uma2 family endonuclease
MTVEDFLNWSGDGHVGKLELVDGVVRAMAPPSQTHGTIQANLARHIGNHLAARRSPCRVITEAPVVPRFKPETNARAPDLAVECAPPSTSRVLQKPTLIIELLSPSNADETWESIRAVANLPSVLEVMVVHSTEIRVETFLKDREGGWPAAPVVFDRLDAMVRLASIDAELPLADIYAGTVFGA